MKSIPEIPLLESSSREPQKALSDVSADSFGLTKQDLDEI